MVKIPAKVDRPCTSRDMFFWPSQFHYDSLLTGILLVASYSITSQSSAGKTFLIKSIINNTLPTMN